MHIQTTSWGRFDWIRIRCASDANQVNAHSCERNRSGSDAHLMCIKVPMWKRLYRLSTKFDQAANRFTLYSGKHLMCPGNVLSELLLLLQVILLLSVSVTAFLEGSGVSSLYTYMVLTLQAVVILLHHFVWYLLYMYIYRNRRIERTVLSLIVSFSFLEMNHAIAATNVYKHTLLSSIDLLDGIWFSVSAHLLLCRLLH